MSNQSESTLNSPQAADPLKDDRLERDRHLPTMPDPTHDQDAEVRLPNDEDPAQPSKRVSLIDEPQPIEDEDETDGLEKIA